MKLTKSGMSYGNNTVKKEKKRLWLPSLGGKVGEYNVTCATQNGQDDFWKY